MFSLTPGAATAMIAARADAGAPDHWGIRFSSAMEAPLGVTFDFVVGPQPNDILGGSDELRTYVEFEVHREIGHATVDYEDVDGHAGLVVRPHPRDQLQRLLPRRWPGS